MSSTKSIVFISLVIIAILFGAYQGIQSSSSNNTSNAMITNSQIHTPISKTDQIKINMAKDLASQINNSPDITLEDIGDVTKITQIIDYYNSMSPILAIDLGINLKPVDINWIKLEKYIPLIPAYHNLKEAALNLNENDMLSIDNFYVNLFSFALDGAFISTGGIDQISKVSADTVIAVMKDTQIEREITSLCESSCSKKFEDNTYYFVLALGGQLPTLSQWETIVQSQNLNNVGNEMNYMINSVKNFVSWPPQFLK